MENLDNILGKIADFIIVLCVIVGVIYLIGCGINYRNNLIAKEVVKELNKTP
jgi:hypothetical protein